MRQNRLSICDADKKYVERLGELLRLREAFPFEVSTYTAAEQMEKSGKLAGTDMLLISMQEYNRLILQEKWKDIREEKVVVILDDGKQTIPSDQHTIYKYQSGEVIRREILLCYGKVKGNKLQSVTGHRQTKIAGVYSPVGRCGQTSFCVLLGQILAKKKKVLYLNFEPYSGLMQSAGGMENKNITDLIYAMHGEKERLPYHMESMLLNMNGLDYIAPAASFLDLLAVSADNWVIFLEALRQMGNYDLIILDLSEMVNGLFEILRQCQIVYTITQKDGFAANKVAQYEHLLMNYEYADVKEKTTTCEFPVFKNLPDNIEQLPYSDLAGYIRQMLQREPQLWD